MMVKLSDDMQQIVEFQMLGFVATVCPDGTPNVSPKGSVAVWDDEHLVFADIASPGTIANLRQNPAVEINVVDALSRRGYRFKGTARIVDGGEELDRIIAFYHARGKKSPIRAGVIVAVETAAPLISPGYAQGFTEEELRERWLRHYSGADAPAANATISVTSGV